LLIDDGPAQIEHLHRLRHCVQCPARQLLEPGEPRDNALRIPRSAVALDQMPRP
jgi:hypothetical protein